MAEAISATLIAVSAQFLQCILHDVSMSADYTERDCAVLDGGRILTPAAKNFMAA
jgi:hypothetical protein